MLKKYLFKAKPKSNQVFFVPQRNYTVPLKTRFYFHYNIGPVHQPP